MSIYGAMFSSVSGLRAQSTAFGTISDNISNVNTIGYKGTDTQFATLVTAAATRNTYTPGGVRALPMQQIDRQGLIQGSPSASSTDVAIAGNGFFVVNQAANPGAGNDYLFTRAGSFRPDKAGNLVNSAGYYLQGWPLDNGGLPNNTTVLTSLETVNIANLSGTAQRTENVRLGLNLPSAADIGTVHATTVQVYDSLGNAHDIELVFEKTGENAWDITANDPTLVSTGAASGTITGGGVGSITFTGDGIPTAIDFGPLEIDWSITGANDSEIAFNLGDIGRANGVTQYSGIFEPSFVDQDGAAFGSFTEVVIDEAGVVTAVFDNGQRRQLYQLPIAMFANPNGLQAQDGNAFLQTDRSGDLLLQQANSGGAGVIVPEALEASTVDIAEEFTRMITTQKAYSAAARTITTADEMLDELIALRR